MMFKCKIIGLPTLMHHSGTSTGQSTLEIGKLSQSHVLKSNPQIIYDQMMTHNYLCDIYD